MPGEISRSSEGPKNGVPLVPSWVPPLPESIWANEPGIQLWIDYEGPCIKLQIVKVPENEIIVKVTLAPHRAKRLGDLMPKEHTPARTEWVEKVEDKLEQIKLGAEWYLQDGMPQKAVEEMKGIAEEALALVRKTEER